MDTVSTTCVSYDRVLPCTDVPQPVTDEIAFTALVANLSYTCGLGDGGHAYCWGSNDWGQLADGETVDRAPPEPLVGEPAFSSVTAGRSFACAQDAEGQAFCWGRNSNGNFGLGNKWGGIIPQPVAAATGLRFESLTAGHSHTCGVDLEGFVWCFGASTRGEVGTGEYFVSALRPVRVEGQR